MLRLGAKFVLSFAWRCPSHFLLVSLCSSFLSSPKSPALCRAVTCGLVLSVPDLAGASSCLSFLFPEGLFQSRAELASGVVRSPPPPPPCPRGLCSGPSTLTRGFGISLHPGRLILGSNPSWSFCFRPCPQEGG